jgi:hypothetical protein
LKTGPIGCPETSLTSNQRCITSQKSEDLDDDDDDDDDNNNNNNNNKEAEILKYKALTIEIHRMWKVKTRVIPVIIGATGTISKSYRKYISNIPGNHEVKELQKTAILGTAHILRKVLT